MINATAPFSPWEPPIIPFTKSWADFLLTPGHSTWSLARTLFYPWLIQFVFSWVGFTIYMVWDYRCMLAGRLEVDKLPSRHPIHVSPLEDREVAPDGTAQVWLGVLPAFLCPRLSPFWYSQLFMVPMVLFNQCVVWPLASLLVVWPSWAGRDGERVGEWAGGGSLGLLPSLLALMLVSDQLWYWSHRLMHTPWAWRNLHKMHHIAPQCAISATYVHPWEYTLFTISMQLPFALAGFPLLPYLIPMGWGMLTGSGAHSGYGGEFANGEKHGTGHHLYHNANFGLLMVADWVWGTHWEPGDPPPPAFPLGDAIESAYTQVKGAGAKKAVEALLAKPQPPHAPGAVEESKKVV